MSSSAIDSAVASKIWSLNGQFLNEQLFALSDKRKKKSQFLNIAIWGS